MRELLDLAKQIFGDDPKKFIKDSAIVFADLKKAKTPDEKAAAASNLSQLISRL